jgi:hypothetical protein
MISSLQFSRFIIPAITQYYTTPLSSPVFPHPVFIHAQLVPHSDVKNPFWIILCNTKLQLKCSISLFTYSFEIHQSTYHSHSLPAPCSKSLTTTGKYHLTNLSVKTSRNPSLLQAPHTLKTFQYQSHL